MSSWQRIWRLMPSERLPYVTALEMDCVAEDAVRSETVSRVDVPCNLAICSEVFRELQGDCRFPVLFNNDFNMLQRAIAIQGAGTDFRHCREDFGYLQGRGSVVSRD